MTNELLLGAILGVAISELIWLVTMAYLYHSNDDEISLIFKKIRFKVASILLTTLILVLIILVSLAVFYEIYQPNLTVTYLI